LAKADKTLEHFKNITADCKFSLNIGLNLELEAHPKLGEEDASEILPRRKASLPPKEAETESRCGEEEELDKGQGHAVPRKSVKDYCGRCFRKVRHIFAVVEGEERKLCTNCDANVIRILMIVVNLRDSNPEPFKSEMALSGQSLLRTEQRLQSAGDS
jgi:hypothetical protein